MSNNRLTITLDNEEDAKKILEILLDAEDEGEIDFPFWIFTSDYPL